MDRLRILMKGLFKGFFALMDWTGLSSECRRGLLDLDRLLVYLPM